MNGIVCRGLDPPLKRNPLDQVSIFCDIAVVVVVVAVAVAAVVVVSAADVVKSFAAVVVVSTVAVVYSTAVVVGRIKTAPKSSFNLRPSSASGTVRPDLAKFQRLGKLLIVFGNFLNVYIQYFAIFCYFML